MFLLLQNLFLYITRWSSLTVFKKTDWLVKILFGLHVVLKLELHSLSDVICSVFWGGSWAGLATRFGLEWCCSFWAVFLWALSLGRCIGMPRSRRASGAHFLCRDHWAISCLFRFAFFAGFFSDLPIFVGWCACRFLLFGWCRSWSIFDLLLLVGKHDWFSGFLLLPNADIGRLV